MHNKAKSDYNVWIIGDNVDQIKKTIQYWGKCNNWPNGNNWLARIVERVKLDWSSKNGLGWILFMARSYYDIGFL